MTHRKESLSPKTTTESAAQLLGVVRELVSEIRPGYEKSFQPVLDSSLERDLGLDSLTQMELLGRVEGHFNVSIPEQTLATVDTVRDLLRAVMSAETRKPEEVALEIAEIKLDEVTDAPTAAATLVEVLQWHVAEHPDRPHIRLYSDRNSDEVITYMNLWQGAETAAAGLQQSGLQPGESVLIMLPTGPEYFYTFFGILLAGGIPVPVYPPGRIKQIEEHLLRHTAIAENSLARIMVTMGEAKKFAKLMHSKVVRLRDIMTFPELHELGRATLAGFRKPSLAAGDIAFLQYTSGSTGMPKGVVLTHANLLANIRTMAKVLGVTSEDVFVSWLPLYHDMGLIGAWLGSLHFACQLVIMPPLAFIAKPQRWLWAIHKYGGTLSAAPNFAYELCLRRVDDRDIKGLDLRSWRIACNGAEAVNPESIRRFVDRFSGYGFRPQAMMPVYGLAESSVGLAFPDPESTFKIDRVRRDIFQETGRAVQVAEEVEDALEFVSCGQPLPGHQIRIVDAADREVPERTEGSLQFSGPSSTSGYFKNPEKTRELFHGQWLDSGDRAYIAGGEVYITGRTKDIIIRAGRNIHPVELEEEIGKIEGIRQGNVAVFGTKSSDSGTERLIILAETRKRDDKDLERLRTGINEIVTDLAGTPPDEVVLAPPNTVLKTSSGKIRRNATREIYEQQLIGKPQKAVWLQVTRFMLKSLRTRIRSSIRQIKALLYASWCWLVYFFLAPVVGILVFLLPFERPRWQVMRLGVRSLAALTRTKITVRGKDNLPEEAEACIFAANHSSYLDGYVLVAVLNRIFSFVAKAELQTKPVVAVLLKRIGTLFVERFDRRKGIENAKEIADTGRASRSLFFFPEGTFMRMAGLLPFRMGAFETAARTGLPIVPVAIRGTRSILRADSWFPRRGMISVTFGRPITIDKGSSESEDTWAAALKLREKTREWILSHCGEPDLGHESSRPQPPGLTLDG